MTEASQQEPVQTGLEGLQAPPPEAQPAPVPEQPQAAVAEPAPNTNPISFDEPVSAADLTAGVGDKPEDAVPLVSAEQLAALQKEAAREDTKRDFTLKVLAARARRDEPEQAPPPLAPRIAEQTNAEIAAGRKMNEHHASLQVHRPHPPAENHGEKHQSVFRPGDYVPDPKKNQGNVQARNL